MIGRISSACAEQNGSVAPAGAAHEGEHQPLHVAMVISSGRLLFLSIELSRTDLTRRVAGYVAEHATVSLWAEEANRVLTLLREGRFEFAIDHYFQHVGHRWDAEFLEYRVLQLSQPPERSLT